MSTKALKSQLLAAVAMVLVASVALGSSTFAWFAANRTVTAKDMKVTAQTVGSLVISRTSAPAQNTTLTAVDDLSGSSATFTALLPATHDWDNGTTAGLVYNTNAQAVSMDTGLKKGDEELKFADAVNDEGNSVIYYKDYVVYIASSQQPLKNQDIVAKINVDTVTDRLPGATSIDFYYEDNFSTKASTIATSDNFGGTLNLASKDAEINDGSAMKTEVTISGAGGVEVPKADGAAAHSILMRVYIDGALLEDAGKAYVNTKEATEIADTTLGVEFTAKDHGTTT